jgi:hypothetical protein
MQTRLHSKLTLFHRRPFLWLFAAGAVNPLITKVYDEDFSWVAVLISGVGCGMFLMVLGWVLQWTEEGVPLMDEAVLACTTVRVRRGKVTAEFPLTAVRKVGCNLWRVFLHVDRPTPLGQHISFISPSGFSRIRRVPHPLVAELERQISEARAASEAHQAEPRALEPTEDHQRRDSAGK